jgi:hypothetical protein
MCDNTIGSRCPKRVLRSKEEVEAAETLRKGSAKVKGEEPKGGGARPAVRKRRGRPRKSEKSAAIEDEPQVEEQEATEAAVEAEALQEARDQPPAVRRGRSRDLGPRG